MTNGNTLDIIEKYFEDGKLPGGVSDSEKLLLAAIKQVRIEVRKDIKDLADFTWGVNKDPRDEKSLSYQVQRNSRVIKNFKWAGGIIFSAFLGAIGVAIANILGL